MMSQPIKKEEKQESLTRYISLTINPEKYKEEEKKLMKAGIKLPRSASSLIIENESDQPTVYQKHSKIGQGIWGKVYLFKPLDQKIPNKVIKVDINLCNKFIFTQLLPGLKEELKELNEKNTCNYETLIKYLNYKKQSIKLIAQATPEVMKKYLKDVIDSIEINYVQRNMNNIFSCLQNENKLINLVYGNSVILDGCRLSMLFLEGETLETLLKKYPPTMLQALDLLYDIIPPYKVLSYLGIALIDITTNNIIMDSEGNITPCDFGHAKKYGTHFKYDCDPAIYLQFAPEIGEGTIVDQRLDIYALGYILHYIFACAKQTKAKEEASLISDLNNLCGKMREPNPKDRTITYEEIQETLLNLRKKYYPKAHALTPKLHPIFAEKLKTFEEEKAQQSIRSKP